MAIVPELLALIEELRGENALLRQRIAELERRLVVSRFLEPR